MGVRPASDVLRDLRFGEFMEELSNKFNDLVKAVENTEKAGSITITLKLKPSTAGAIEVADDIKVKTPILSKSASLFFATVEGNLVRNDPRQKDIFGLKEVDKNEVRAQFKEAAATTQPLKEANAK